MRATERRWDPVKAQELARAAYSYVASILPADANLEPIGRADRMALDAEAARDFDAYEEALRQVCVAARREARRRAA